MVREGDIYVCIHNTSKLAFLLGMILIIDLSPHLLSVAL